MTMVLQTAIFVLFLTIPILAKPEGYYHQEYQYKQSSSSFKNNELQHKKDDEGFFTKDGDLSGSQDPKVNEQHEHREFLNPKLRAQGYTEQDFAGTGLDLHGRSQQFHDQFGALQSGTTLSTGMQSFMANLQEDMQQKLQRQLQQWRQDQEEYSHGNQNRYSSTSSGLYSPSTASVDTIRRELQEEIRTNLTREIDLRNTVAQTHYDSTDLKDIKGQLQANLMRQLNVLMQEQQDRMNHQTYPTNVGGSTRQTSASSRAVKTKSASSQTNYTPVTPTNQYSSYEQDDLNRNQQYYQQQRYYQPRPSAPIVPDQYVYTPSSSSSASRAASTYGSTMYGGSSSTAFENRTPVVRNINQITEIAQQVQNDMQKVLIKALDQYQLENSFNPSNKYQTKPDYNYARQDFESRLQYNLTEQFRTVLDRNFGEQDLRGQYYFSRGTGNQRFANYKQEDYERLKQQVTENLQKYLRDCLKTQEEYYETQQRAHATHASSSSQTAASYTPMGGQHIPPYPENYYTSRPSTAGDHSGSRSYSSSSSYSGSAAYQTETRPLQTGIQYTKSYYPTGGYRSTSDSTMHGTFAKYQNRGDQARSEPEDCDEGMQGDDPNAFGVQSRHVPGGFGSYQRPISYSDALRTPVTSEEDYQRPISELEDYQRPIEDFGKLTTSSGNYQSVGRDLEVRRPWSSFYDNERQYYGGRSGQGVGYSLNKPKTGQISVDSNDYDDDIRANENINVNIEIERPTPRSTPNSANMYNIIPKTIVLPPPQIYETSTKNAAEARIDEIAQKLNDNSFEGQRVEDDDVEQFNFGNTKPGNVYPTTERFNLDPPRPRIYYKPYSVDITSSTPKYDLDTYNWQPKTTPKYNYFNRPIYSSNSRFDGRTTSTEAPKQVAPIIDVQKQHLEDSYEDLLVHKNPTYVKPTNSVQSVQKPQKYPDDEDFLDSMLRLPKAVNIDDDDDDNDDDLDQKPVDDNQEVVISSHRGDIDSFAKPNLDRRPMAHSRDLPIRLADISEVQIQTRTTERPNINADDVQRPLEDLDDIENIPVRLSDSTRGRYRNPYNQKPAYIRNNLDGNIDDVQRLVEDPIDPPRPLGLNENSPIRLTDISRPQNQPKFSYYPDQYSDDVQKPMEDSIDPQMPLGVNVNSPRRLTEISRSQNKPKPLFYDDQYSDDLQKPVEDLDDLQRPMEEETYDNYENQFQGQHHGRSSDHFVQNGRRLPDTYTSLTEAPQAEVLEHVIQKQQVKPLSSDYNINEEVESNVADNPSFWRKVGGKITNTYNNAKQKAREIAEKINFL